MVKKFVSKLGLIKGGDDDDETNKKSSSKERRKEKAKAEGDAEKNVGRFKK